MQRLLVLALAFAGCASSSSSVAPLAARHPVTRTDFGVTRTDDYAWLRQQDSPAVLKHLADENAYTDRVMKPTEPLQKTLVDEFVAHTKLDDASVPHPRDGWLYFSTTDKDSDYPRFYRKREANASPQLLLDLNELAKTRDYVGLGASEPSDNGKLLAYTIDPTGFRQYTLAVKDLESGTLLPDTAARVGSVCWANDNRTLFYSTENDAKRSDKIWRLTLGDKSPTLVYEETDATFDVGVGKTTDKAFVIISAFSYGTADASVIPADKPEMKPEVIGPRKAGVETYIASHRDGQFFIRTNDTGRNFRLVTDADHEAGDVTESRYFVELIPARERVFLEDVNCFKNHVVLTERADGLPRVSTFDVERRRIEPIEMPESVYAVRLGPNEVFDTDELRLTYESLVTPPTTFAFDMNARTLATLKREEVPGGYDPAKYEEHQIFATARDGTRVPISYVARKDRPAGPGPLYVDVYGAYGIPEWVWFEPERLSLLDRGVAFAICHVRGGGELGKTWHDQGRLMNKRHTFEDTTDCVSFLQSHGIASPQTTAIGGASAGGLTVGATLNLRPDLFKCALLGVPFVDVMNTMLDPSLPLTTQEYNEWGNPHESAAFAYMLGYSPYDNLRRADYPATLVFSSYHDSQVMYWEPTKYVAKRRALNASATPPLLLNMTMTGGHGGPSGRTGAFDETAKRYAFVLWQLGLMK